MDAAVIACPRCQRRLQLPGELMAKQVMCPGCTFMFFPNGQEPPKAGPREANLRPVNKEQREPARAIPQRRSLPADSAGAATSSPAWSGPVPPVRKPRPARLPENEDHLPTAELLESAPSPGRRTGELLSIDPEPTRPFRRRPPLRPKRASRNSLLVPLAIGGGLLGLALIGVVIYFLVKLVASGGWQEFRSKEGGFVVEMPGKPKTPTQARGLGVNMYIVERSRNEAYMVGYVDVPGFVQPQQAEQLFDMGGRNGLAGLRATPFGGGGHISRQTPVSFEGHPGREFVIEVPGQGTAILRLYLVNSRMFMLMAASTRMTADSADAKRFFNSFKVNPHGQ